jgi:hypothetical protein
MKPAQQEHRAQIASLLESYRRSGLTRREFCQQIGISVSTLDYHRRRESKAQPRLIRVNIEAPSSVVDNRLTLVLKNGRRIETNVHFDEAALARLIRIAEEVA